MTDDPDALPMPLDEEEFEGFEQLLRGAFGDPAAWSAPDAAADEPEPPALLPARYRCLGEIGRGGVGVVLAAEDTTLARRIAVKVLQARHRHSTVMQQKFAAEAQIGAQLQHPGILSVLDVGRTADDRAFFTMRLVPGDTLGTRLGLRDPGDLQLATWLPVFARVGEAVAYAHARGVVHRDLKPGNVLVGAFGEVLVTDWGMAKLVAAAGPSPGPAFVADEPVTTTGFGEAVVSVTGSLWGTPAYMAPEQARGAADAATLRADVFGLGAMLCEILTGSPPYVGSLEVVLVKARLGDLRDAEARLRNSHAPADLVELTLCCLAADPQRRPADASEVAASVQQHLASLQDRAHHAALATVAAEARAAADRRTRRVQAAWFATGIAVLLAAGGTWIWLDREARVRLRRNEQAVENVLAEGRDRWREAVLRGNEADWRAVTASASAALVLAQSGSVDDGVLARCRQFLREAEDEATAAAQAAAQRADEAAIRARLDGLNWRQWLDNNLREKESGYAALFTDLGIDPTVADAAPAVAKVRAHRLAMDLAIALDRWASTCRQLPLPPERAIAIQAVARAVDSDALRLRLRDLIARPDPLSVRRLAATTDLQASASASIFLLFDAARAAQLPDVAHDVLVRGQLLHPTDFGLTCQLAQECGARGDAAGEMRYAAAALSLQPDGVHAGVRLATQLSARGRADHAELLLRRLLERHPEDVHLQHNVAASLAEQRRHAEALPLLRRIEQAGAGNDLTALVAAKCERAARNFDEAKRWFAIAAERNPRNHDIQVSLGAMLCDDLRDYGDALDAFDRALALRPDATDAMRNRAVVLEFLGRADEAYEQWELLADAVPSQGEALVRLAVTDFNQGRLLLAIDHATEALRRGFQSADAWYVLGSSLLGVEERTGAIAALRTAVRIEPGHGQAWHDLGWTLAEDSVSRKEAIDALQRAVALLPQFAMAHYNLARALFLDEQFEASRRAVDAALQLAPDMAQARDLLARLQAR